MPGFLFHTPDVEGEKAANLFGFKIPEGLFHGDVEGAFVAAAPFNTVILTADS